MGARFVVLTPLLSPSLWVLNFGEAIKIRVFVINLFLPSFLEDFGLSKFASTSQLSAVNKNVISIG
jgi:hypothetical protein